MNEINNRPVIRILNRFIKYSDYDGLPIICEHYTWKYGGMEIPFFTTAYYRIILN